MNIEHAIIYNRGIQSNKSEKDSTVNYFSLLSSVQTHLDIEIIVSPLVTVYVQNYCIFIFRLFSPLITERFYLCKSCEVLPWKIQRIRRNFFPPKIMGFGKFASSMDLDMSLFFLSKCLLQRWNFQLSDNWLKWVVERETGYKIIIQLFNVHKYAQIFEIIHTLGKLLNKQLLLNGGGEPLDEQSVMMMIHKILPADQMTLLPSNNSSRSSHWPCTEVGRSWNEKQQKCVCKFN